jgi:hypothetical protein
MNAIATIAKNQLSVRSDTTPNGLKYLTLDLPEGWDTLKNLTNKVLTFDGQTYTYRGWNSDRNEAFFYLNNNVATVSRSR